MNKKAKKYWYSKIFTKNQYVLYQYVQNKKIIIFKIKFL